jgi:hypothetical protein
VTPEIELVDTRLDAAEINFKLQDGITVRQYSVADCIRYRLRSALRYDE